MKYQFPTKYGENCILVPIDTALAPIVSGALLHFQLRGYWQTEQDYEQGYNAFAELQAAMANNCLSALVESNDRLYRLLDTALNGTIYTLSSDPVPVVEPVIPPVPSAFQPTEPAALRSQLARLHQLAENAATGAELAGGFVMDGAVNLDYEGSWRARLEALQGDINEGWFGIGGQPATLADLVSALRVGSSGDTTRITDAISAIAGDTALAQGSQAANIFGTVSGLFADVAETGAEGAVLGTLIAASIATSGMIGVLSSQIDRLITAMGESQGTNVVTELEEIKVQLQ